MILETWYLQIYNKMVGAPFGQTELKHLFWTACSVYALAAKRFKTTSLSYILENLNKGFLLEGLFRRGINIGIYFLYGRIPEGKHEKIVQEKLVKFLKLGRLALNLCFVGSRTNMFVLYFVP